MRPHIRLGGTASNCVSVCCSTVGWRNRLPGTVGSLRLRVRLDDTLTSTDSEVGDFLQLLLTQEYQGARVYGHVAAVDMSGEPS